MHLHVELDVEFLIKTTKTHTNAEKRGVIYTGELYIRVVIHVDGLPNRVFGSNTDGFCEKAIFVKCMIICSMTCPAKIL